MRKKALWLLALSSILLLGSNAVAITVDGNPVDWLGSTAPAGQWSDAAGQLSYIDGLSVPGSPLNNFAFTPNLPTADLASGYANYYREDGPGEQVTPGYGGQDFDMEAMYYWYADGGSADGLYVGVFTGFDSIGEYSSGWYYAGDLFFNIGGDSSWDFAIETTGANAGHVYAPTSSSWWTAVTVPSYSVSNPYAINTANAVDVTNLFGLSGSALVYNNRGAVDGGVGDHNFIEAYVDEALLVWGQANGYWSGLSATGDTSIVSHWTMSCGNDYANVSAKVPPVPEPATMLMFGCLGLGMFVARKVRAKKS